MDAKEISSIVGATPTSSVAIGDVRGRSVSPPQYHHQHCWRFCTRDMSDSRDCRRHLDILIDKVLGAGATISHLRACGCDFSVVVFYGYTQGGPTISPPQMAAFARAGLDVCWDLYRDADECGEIRGTQ